ncbi:hypothetical protein AGMMS4956_11630 [Bacteroidia bacterium]|nr:hypothetical protein AGMMS4956_11630 [Bacteroidia bacterium]
MKKHFILHPIFALAAAAGFSAVVMLLWNALVPAIFGLAVINFWQALGLLVLARLLFGGFGWSGFAGHHCRHAHGGFGKNPIREKWKKMSTEERKEFVRKQCECADKMRGFAHRRHDFYGAENCGCGAEDCDCGTDDQANKKNE